MRPFVVPSLLLAAVLTGCGTEGVVAPGSATAPGAASPPTATTTAGPTAGPGEGMTKAPPFRVQYGGRELELHPYTYCLDSARVDGFEPASATVGAAAELRIHVPVRGLELEASMAQVLDGQARWDEQGRCPGRTFAAPVEDLGGGWFLLRPFGPPGTYEVDLFASGHGGDMAGALRWESPGSTAMPQPHARLALIADHDGRPDSYGLELEVGDLAATPARATARIQVTAGNGRSTTITPGPSAGTCEGDLFFTAPDRVAKDAAALGGFPFTTTVTLTIDGAVHTASAVYPDDEIEGNEPSVALTFDPPLPGL